MLRGAAAAGGAGPERGPLRRRGSSGRGDRGLKLDEVYQEQDALGALDESLGPRGPDWLYGLAGSLGAGPGKVVLDVGCGDARRLVELRRRLGCAGVGLDLVAAQLDRARLGDAAPPLVRGRAEVLPVAAASVDLVWIRDVLVHVSALRYVFEEVRRVLRPGGRAVVFQMFATPRLLHEEAAWLWPTLAVVPASTDRTVFEAALSAGGLVIDQRHDLVSEWREHGEESGDRRTSRQLLRAARLLRQEDRFRSLLGDHGYDAELADSLWGVYQMIGKLAPSVYVLR